ncbi:MAG: element excision factor XisH family protein, partial [Waterburya sp.]
LRELFVDLGAKKLIAAQKGESKIAVEIKSFIGRSPINELENALGQYILYRNILEETEPERLIYLAIRKSTYQEIFSEPIGVLTIQKSQLRVLVFDDDKEEIIQWIN